MIGRMQKKSKSVTDTAKDILIKRLYHFTVTITIALKVTFNLLLNHILI